MSAVSMSTAASIRRPTSGFSRGTTDARRSSVGDLLGKAKLRAGLDTEAAADIVWVMNDPGLYRMLVHERGWTPERFESWLAETLQRQLLPG
jgi:prophage antirepressor-like protein